MSKLTDEWIIALHNRAEIITNCREHALYVARAIEAEVLRLNGITDNRARIEAAQRARMNAHFAGRPPTQPSPDFDLPQAYDESEPRATGCPDTMDDTGHFAEVDMPAFLRKQNPA